MPGVYIHIPFCKQLCTYCDFHFSVSLQRKDEMLLAICSEIERDADKAEWLQTPGFKTLYFGGGTPTLYTPTQLKQIADLVFKYLLPKGVDEWTVEANPDDLTDAYLEELQAIGVNRLSIGIQSFIDADLIWMKRRHTAIEARQAVERAQKHGFNNISVDLIYGLPSLTEQQWKYNIQQAIALNVQHLSAYHLTIEPKTILGKQVARGLVTPIHDELSGEQYKVLSEQLQAAGFEHYEVANFALAGYQSKHNSAYWQQQAYLAYGPSAHGYDGSYTRYSTLAHNLKYIQALRNNVATRQFETLTKTDIYHEYLLTSLRTSRGIDSNNLVEPFKTHFLKEVQRYIPSGRIIKQGDVYKIPPTYYIVSDSIVTQLFFE